MSNSEDKTQNGRTATSNNAASLGFIPQDIPFNDEQRQWLGGFFAGLHSKLMVVEGTSTQAAVPASTRPITIVYGTQTGNAEGVAELAAEQAKSQGLSPVVLDMDDVTLDQLGQIERLLIVTSTYGEGEMPDNAQALWDAISEDSAPQLAQLNYSVLALGDTSYDEFCLAGKLWDERLTELGATRVTNRVDCDVAFEEPAQGWMDATIPAIAEKGSDSAGDTATTAAPAPKPAKSKFNRANPLMATLTTKKVLTHSESSKEVMHFEFSLGDSGEAYQAGDALNIIPLNRNDLVEEVLTYFSADGDMTLAGADKPLKQQLIQELEIRTPSKELVAHIASLSEDSTFKAFIDNDDKAGLSDFLWAQDSLDLLIKYQEPLAGKLSIEAFVGLCKPLAARAYSISSSIKKHANEVHLTIGSVRYNAQDRDHNGVCSTFLADEAQEGDTVACYFSPNKNFAVPEDSNLPIIMVGPGTGIAPFRSFLEEREMTDAKGANWLFFGDRNSKTDFLYRDELEAMQAQGLLSQLDLAFSRDQNEKVYVQDKMREQGAQLFAYLEQGGYFYICGDALRMAKDVDKALHDVIETEGKMNAEQAAEYVNALKKNKRYVRDVY